LPPWGELPAQGEVGTIITHENYLSIYNIGMGKMFSGKSKRGNYF